MAGIGPTTSSTLPAGVQAFEPTAHGALPESAWPGAIESAARELDFARVGFAGTEAFSEAGRNLAHFLAAARHGSMSYLDRAPRHEPKLLLPEALSIIAVALVYPGGAELVRLRKKVPLEARVAGYAVGRDYHQVVKAKLLALGQACATLLGRRVLARPCVDTAPLLEREALRRAGVGFIGKSAMCIIPGVGSYFLAGELLVDVALPPTPPVAEGCGRCRACLDACPTGAFVDAYELDARRCIAYLTIEHRGIIPRELRRPIGDRAFGCDECQDVCPYNATAHKHRQASALEPRDEVLGLTLPDLLEMSAADYRRLVRGSALGRATRRMLQRNAAICLGNSRSPDAVRSLLRALRSTSDLVRGHAAWALGQLAAHATDAIRRALEELAETDPADWVRGEARDALASIGEPG